MVLSDILSIYAHNSPFDCEEQSDGAAESKQLQSSLGEGASNITNSRDGEPSANDIISKVLSAAKIVGLSVPVQAPAPVDGVWVGCVQMLSKAWNAPSGAPQFNAGCRRLAKLQYAPETGLGDMPPVEQGMAALTFLGPELVTANPCCPV